MLFYYYGNLFKLSSHKKTYEIWEKRNPHLTKSLSTDPNKRANTRRYIKKNGLIPEETYKKIKNEVVRITVKNKKENIEIGNSTSEKEQRHIYTTASPEKENTTLLSERISSEIQKKILQIFEKVRTKEITQRQPLKKITETKARKAKKNEVNENLGKILEKIVPLSLSDLNHLIFALAAHVSQPKKEINKNNVQAKPKISSWKIRLQEKIKNLRKDLSIIEEILKDNKSSKVKTKANLVKKKLRMEENICEEISEALKQNSSQSTQNSKI